MKMESVGFLCVLREDVWSACLGLALSTMTDVVLEVGLEELLVLDGVACLEKSA